MYIFLTEIHPFDSTQPSKRRMELWASLTYYLHIYLYILGGLTKMSPALPSLEVPTDKVMMNSWASLIR